MSLHLPIGAIVRSAPFVVPGLLVMWLAAGLYFVLHDYREARRDARQKGQPVPGPSLLLVELSESLILAYFVFAVGFLAGLIGLIAASRLESEVNSRLIALTVSGLATGLALFRVAFTMVQRSDARMRSWRTRLRK